MLHLFTRYVKTVAMTSCQLITGSEIARTRDDRLVIALDKRRPMTITQPVSQLAAAVGASPVLIPAEAAT
jgi:hypothetical protein